MLTVLLPNFNHSKYLEKRISSILNQTFQNFELIILDDKSSDDSLEILEKYKKHPKVSHFILNQQNSGSTFAQWQKGISLAKGKYIWIAESDDYADYDFLNKNISRLEKDEDIVFSYCQSIIIDEKDSEQYSNLKWTSNFEDNPWENDFILEGKKLIEKYFYLKNIVPNASAVVFRKAKVDVGLLNDLKEFKMVGDWLFWIFLANQGKVSFVKQTLNYFRTSSQTTRNHNTSNKKIERLIEEVKIFQIIKKRFSKLKIDYNQIDKRQIIKWLKINSTFRILSNKYINKNLLYPNSWFLFKYLLRK